MYTQDIVVSQIVYARLKKKMEDIKKNVDASEIHTPQIQSFGDISSQILEKYI